MFGPAAPADSSHAGDRFVVVASEGTDDELLAIAKAVRPASNDAWNAQV